MVTLMRDSGQMTGLHDAVTTGNDVPAAALTDINGHLNMVLVTFQIEHVERHVVPIRGEDYPSLAAIWENDEDDAPPAEASGEAAGRH